MIETIEVNTSFIQVSQDKIAIVDTEDYYFLDQWKWYQLKSKHSTYAVNSTSKLLHRKLLNAPKGMEVDHINGDGLDNRKSNLRLVSRRQNCQNRVHINKSSKYSGVYWSNKSQRWRSKIHVGNKMKYLGDFKHEEEAAKAYEKACKEIFGEDLVYKIDSFSNTSTRDFQTIPLAKRHYMKKFVRKFGKNKIKSSSNRRYKGADFIKRANPERKCWRSKIRYHSFQTVLGYFEDPLSASLVYDLVFEEIYGG